MYPKNNYKFQLKFNTEPVNKHSFNLGGLFSQLAGNFRKRFSSFNPFKFATTTTTTTTESSLDFSIEETDDSTSTSDNGNGSKNGSSNGNGSKNDDDKDDKDESHDVGGGVAANGHEHTGYQYSTPATVTIETVNVDYLPPFSTPDSNYLPPN